MERPEIELRNNIVVGACEMPRRIYKTSYAQKASYFLVPSVLFLLNVAICFYFYVIMLLSITLSKFTILERDYVAYMLA